MGLFYRRPLALCAFSFILASVLGFYLSTGVKLQIAIVSFCLFVIVLVLAFVIKKFKLKLLALSICFIAIIGSFGHSALFISQPKENASQLVGKNTALCYVVDVKSVSENSANYLVKINNVGGNTTDIRGYLYCDFNADINMGDEIYGIGNINMVANDKIASDGAILTVHMSDINKCYARYSSEGKGFFDILFSECGLEILASKIGNKIGEVLVDLLGEERGILALGFFTGERAELPAYIVRDFKRSGLTHIMAVSGSHIAILLGSIEVLLRKLFVPKSARCAVISVCGIAFVIITGFSLSGIRSVLMLYAVYLAYLTYEDNDPITSLFVSISFIILVFPFSVADLGLWMSFLATLGLLTVYPVIEEKIPYPRMKNKFVKTVLIILRQILTSAVITLVANMLLLPIIWYYFGEISIVSIISNIVIGPIASAFLVSIPILLIIGKIPFVGACAAWCVSAIADIIIYLVGIFSKTPDATLSLKYQVCAITVIIFTAVTVVMLLIKFKRKLWIVAPYICAVAVLIASSLYMGKIATPASLTYNKIYGGDELFIISEGSDVSVCDNSSGGLASALATLREVDNTYATELDCYVLTHYHSGHIYSLDVLTQQLIVRALYMPVPSNDEEKLVSQTIWNMAKDRGLDVFFYDGGEELRLSENAAMKTKRSEKHQKGRTIAFYGKSGSVIYANPAFCDVNIKYDQLIIGEHGVKGELPYNIDGINAKAIYVTSKNIDDLLEYKRIDNIYRPKSWEAGFKAIFEFDK